MDIPEEILEDARRASHSRTKRDTVVAGLEELIRKGKREQIRGLAKKLRLRVDLKASRRQ